MVKVDKSREQSVPDLFSCYGEHIAEYSGQGALTFKDGSKIDCEFKAGQLANGNILLKCDFLFADSFCREVPVINFDGRTKEGWTISSKNEFFKSSSEISPTKISAIFLLQELHVKISENNCINEIRVGLTNFKFIGTDVEETASGWSRNILNLNINGYKFSIKRVDAYETVMNLLFSSNNIEVTCEITSGVSSEKEVPKKLDIISNICYLLSIASGTKVQWIYYNVYDDVNIIAKAHFARPTKKYNTLATIKPVWNGGHSTKNFVESTYERFIARKEAYNLEEGDIDAYLDAKQDGDCLQVSGAKLAVSMESLKATFIRSHNSNIKEFIIDKPKFEKELVDPIKNSISIVLQKNGICEEQRGAIYRNLRGLNRTAFRDLLVVIFKEIDLCINQNDLKLFIECRNKLVHDGRFYCQVATQKEREICPPLPDIVSEYFFLIGFLDKVILKLIGYSGPYIDWSQGRENQSQL